MTDLIDNYSLLVIPSWSNLLGFPTLGKYAHHQISSISQDIVVFFMNSESSIETENGVFYIIFGIGYYRTKFELGVSGRYITDNRELSGLILSDFVYDLLANSRNITLEDDLDVIVNENLFRIPLDLSNKSENQKTFIQGVLMRNLFIPYKDVFLELMDHIRKPQSYQIEHTGQMILSTHWDSFNKIMISDRMESSEYSQSTAGLNEISSGVEEILNINFKKKNIIDINENIKKLKQVYTNIEYDKMYLISILDKAYLSLRHEIKPKKKEIQSKIAKKHILKSALPYLETFKHWPTHLIRQTKKQLEKTFIPEKTTKYEPNAPTLEKPLVKDYRAKEENFQIRTMKRPQIEIKALPKIPTSNAVDILKTLKKIVENNYDMQSIGRAVETSRDYIKSMVLHSNYLWDMSKLSNIYQRSEPNLGLSSKEKTELIEKINRWIDISKK